MGDTVKFISDDRGSIAVTFGLSVFAFVGAVALSVDMARLYAAQTSLQQMADSATLAGATYLRDSPDDAIELAAASFDSQKAKHTHAISRTISLGANDTIAAQATATVEMYFGRAFGAQFVNVTVQSEAKFQTGFMDVFLLLDVSASMGLAATPASASLLKQLTKPYLNASGNPAYIAEQGCAFACHQREGWEFGTGSALDFARGNNIPLRWDIVTAASKTMADTLLGTNTQQGSTGIIRVGAYSFGDTLNKVFDPTAIPGNVSFNSTSLLQFNTQLNTSLGEVVANIGTSGDGSQQGTPRKVVVLATDGVDGARGLAHQPVDPAKCDLIKAAGIAIAVIDVRYEKDLTSPFFVDAVLPFYDQISPALQACASSPDLYIQASDAASIQAAFSKMAGIVSSLRPRLTK